MARAAAESTTDDEDVLILPFFETEITPPVKRGIIVVPLSVSSSSPPPSAATTDDAAIDTLLRSLVQKYLRGFLPNFRVDTRKCRKIPERNGTGRNGAEAGSHLHFFCLLSGRCHLCSWLCDHAGVKYEVPSLQRQQSGHQDNGWRKRVMRDYPGIL